MTYQPFSKLNHRFQGLIKNIKKNPQVPYQLIININKVNKKIFECLIFINFELC